MKKLTIFLLFLIGCFSSYSQIGFLEIKTEPSGADVYINGSYEGKTPLFKELNIGTNKVELRYENFESHTLNIQIRTFEVNRQTIKLKEVSGFVVKREESTTVSQAKGQLTIITTPDNSEVFINNTKVNDKTPMTLSELGAGNHKVKVTNWLLQGGNYVPFSIERDVHVRPNSTELLRIDFNDYFGTLNVKSIPSGASIKIGNVAYGVTPQIIDFLSLGKQNVTLTVTLGSTNKENISITREVDIKKGKGNNLNVDFLDLVGSIDIKSTPEASINIDGNNFGNSPKKIDYLTTGKKIVLLTARLPAPYNESFTLSREVDVYKRKTSTLNVNFYDHFKLGSLEITSNNNSASITLENITFSKSWVKQCNYNGEILIGKYKARWMDQSTREFAFEIKDNSLTELFIPIRKSFEREYRISEIPEYISSNVFLVHNFKALPEERTYKSLGFSFQHDQTKWKNAAFGAGCVIFSLSSAAALILHAAGDRGSIKNTATIVAVSSIPFMFTIPAFYIEKRSRPIPINIRRNQTERERLLNSYQDLTNKWEKELELKNSKVREANSEIEEYNRKLPPASVTYK